MKDSDIKAVYRRFALYLGIGVIITASLYMAVQWILLKEIADTLFISLSIGASLFILLFANSVIKYLLDNGPSFYTATITSAEPEKSKNEFDKLLNIFTNLKLSIPFGLAWGTVAGILPFIMGLWPGQPVIATFFGLFLLVVCFITGFFLLILVRFFTVSRKLWDLIEVKLWKRDSIASGFLLSLSSRTSFVASVYTAICITSWLTTPVVPKNSELFIFIFFSTGILIASVIIPIRPYTRKLQTIKRHALKEIDDEIQNEYMDLVETFRSKQKHAELTSINTLIEMRKRIEDVQVYPFKVKTITASLSIILISLLPAFIEVFLKIYFN